MGRFAAMAEEHWRRHLPVAYAAIPDRAAFFARIEEDALDQLVDLAESLRGVDPPVEPFVDKMARYERARQTAEEIVFSEVIFVPPEVRSAGQADQHLDFDDASPDLPVAGQDANLQEVASGRESQPLDFGVMTRIYCQIVQGIPKEQSSLVGDDPERGAFWDTVATEVAAMLAENPSIIFDIPNE